MAKLLKLRRGTTTQHGSFIGAEGEVTIDTSKDTAVVHDGSTTGGTPLAKENMSNVSSASIAGRLGADSIATTKIAGGALPTDVTVASANIVNGTIVNADIASNAAIAGTKLENSGVTAGQYGSSSAIPIVTVDAQGLVTAASTTAVDSTKIQNGTTEVATASSGDITMKRSGTTRLKVDNSGVDVTGNLDVGGNTTIDNGTSSTLTVKCDAGGNAIIRAGAGGQGTGVIEVTQDEGNHGGGIAYNGDGSPSFVSGESSDHVTFYRINAGTRSEVFHYPYNTDVVNFNARPTIAGVGIVKSNDTIANASNVTSSLSSGVTGTTPSTSDNSTKVATTAFVRSAITNYNFPSGTKMLFQQTSAPTGWTKVTTHNNKALRVVSGSASSGGSNAFTSAFAARGINANSGNTTQGGNVSVSVANATQGGNVSVSVGNSTAGGNISVGNTTAGGNVSISNTSTGGNVNSHTLSVNQIPAHSHTNNYFTNSSRNRNNQSGLRGMNQGSGRTDGGASWNTSNTGGNGGHSHGFSGSSHSHNGSLSGTAHNHNANFSGSAHNHNASGSFSGSAHSHTANASFSGSAHNHSISVGNLDMAVQYVDVIIASKN